MQSIAYRRDRNHIAFVGDSRIRQLYFDFADLLSKDGVRAYQTHSDLRFIDEKLRLEVVSSALRRFTTLCWMFFRCLENFACISYSRLEFGWRVFLACAVYSVF